ncbi:penicillin-binding protein activator LpoB [Francisella adeliensis]|uniref:Penicillin-binding protein activator LpoB n=1 Tax=Francisella adeliensis TaxID=2007306 RepID=A0A2Z4XWU0_9GAMM|nr:penicillin-binding protein activator LpoB [Francisella adeliensis]AXA33347.1 penicillin-binding protein activator LpoB [Francisella adeliensis]MBK2085359.1 penicillin-binding protein activator LpoB [Francisella adeliensis]MBK2097089.1 penicillin-binding protein activator LpoB [Francisella adeliensis]QIW11575.1 penicillin-binding protein activator LpoB [Francisella adeliensis]QIW13450.1 penicillin-binding protein activator LpoB [Francisella adeliensis]
MKNKMLTTAFAVGLVISLASCGKTTVAYEDANGIDTTSIDFSSTDLQAMTKDMSEDMLNSRSVKKITAMDTPTLFFSNIRNETREHINTTMLSNTVQTQIIKSGLFQVTDMTQIKNVKEQLGYQANSGMVDQSTATKIGQHIGARYMVYGSIQDIDNTSVDKDKRSKFFLATLKMMDLKTGLVIWQDDKQIRKSQTKSTFGW